MSLSKATVIDAFGWFKDLIIAEVQEDIDAIEPYSLPTASRWQKGGVMIAPDSGLVMSGDYLLATLPTASSSIKGGVKVGGGLSMSGDTLNCTISSGTLDLVTHTQNGLMRATDKVKLDGIDDGAQVNAIERIFVNGTEQPITSKSVDLDLSSFVKKTEIASGVRMKGSLNYFSDLPATAEVGDMYNIKNAGGVDSDGTPIEAGDNVVFTDKGTWDVMAGLIDLSGFAKLTDIAGLSNYTLPTASATEKGGVMIGAGLSMAGETLNCTVKGETYSEFTGATAKTSGAKGLVPAPKTSDQKNFLCGDGTWADPSRFVHVVIGGGGSATAMSSSVSSIQGGLWQDLIDGVPCLKLRYGDYEYNFYYDTTNRTGDGSTPLDTTTKGVEYILSTVPSSEDGQLWYEVTNNHPTLMVHKWAFDYGYNYDTITYKGSNAKLYAYLPLESTTDDACGNAKWTKTGTPTIEKSPAGNNALRNTGGLKFDGAATNAAYTIDFWFYIDLDEFPSGDNVAYNIFSAAFSNSTTVKLTVKNRILSCTGAGTFAIPNASKKRTHFALTRQTASNTTQRATYVYVDGKYQGKTSQVVYRPTVQLFPTTSTDYPAYIDHVRIFREQVVWDGDFTPPSPESYLE